MIEERRRAAEAVLWQLPSVSLAAQAFLLSAGLSSNAEPSSQIIVGLLGLAAVLGTGLVVLYQALRATVFGHWVNQTVSQPLTAEELPSEGLKLNVMQSWLVGRGSNAFYLAWVGALLAFLAADGYVLGRGAGWW